MRYLLKSLLLLINFIPGFVFPALGQDIHFSQYFNAPLSLNPALTGNYHDGYRFILNYRNQWYSVTTPYKTYSVSADLPVLANRRRSFGIGVRVYRDMAGDSKFGTSQADLALSYSRQVDKRSNQLLSFGISAGMAQRQIDYGKLSWDRQYNGNSFDPTLFSGENIPSDNLLYPDLAAGIHWSRKLSRTTDMNLGVSAFHLIRPAVSFYNNDKIRLNTKWTAYASLQYKTGSSILFLPGAAISIQGNYREFMFGTMVKFLSGSSKSAVASFNAGLYSRWNDAVIALVGIDFQSFTAGLSYDINYSGLRKASQLQGGPEISFIYNLPNLRARLPKEAICPIF